MTKIIGFIAVVALAVGITGLFKPDVKSLPSVQGIQGIQGERGLQGQQGVGIKGDKGDKGERGMQGQKGESGAIGMPAKLGALSSPDIPYPYFSFGGLREWANKGTLNQASTTLCSILSPVSTNTLVSANIKITTGTTSAIALEIGKGTLTATTTRLAYQVLGSNAQVTLTAVTATTTGASGVVFTTEPDYVFAPSTYINFKYGGTLGSLNTLVGTCQSKFEEI